MKLTGDVQVENEGCTYYIYLVWMDLGRTSKFIKKRKKIVRKWRLDMFEIHEVKLEGAYREAEAQGFSEVLFGRKWEGVEMARFEEWSVKGMQQHCKC